MHFTKAIFFLITLLTGYYSFSQSVLDQTLSTPGGSYPLHDALQVIKNEGIPLAFSTNKLTNVQVEIEDGETLRSFLERLKSERVISYNVSRSQLIILPYRDPVYTLNGLVKDLETGDHLIGATIQLVNTTSGAVTNGYGYYSITMPAGTYNVIVSHIGYNSITSEVTLDKNTYLSFSIQPTVLQLEEVEVNSLTSDINIASSIPSVTRMNIAREAGQIPYLGSEVDVFQNALLQPGIKTIGEDASGVHIRGGGVDQNLILLDEAIIYNPYHVAFASIFNPEAINDVKIYKGFIPPSYGGRASSVIEVRQREGNKNKTSYSGGIGALSARLLAEGPINKGRSSFLASARQSLINPSIEDFASNSVRRSRNSFQDLNLKINARPNENNTYYLSGYFGNDRNTTGLNAIRNWGNSSLNFRWNHLFSPKVFSNISSYVSEYSYRIESDEEPGAFVSTSRIVDYSIKADLTYAPEPQNEWNFGFSSIFHRLKPGDREPFDVDANTNTIRLDTEHAIESAVYLSQQQDVGKFRFNYGVRLSTFHNIGPEEVRIYRQNSVLADTTVVDTVSFDRNELIQFYQNWEPRLAINWRMNDRSSLKLAYSKTAQYLHLISNTLAPSPTDTWKLSDTYVPPSITHQYTLGYYRNFKDNMWESSLEGYYKDNLQEIAYRDGADLIFNENIETELLIGTGRAFGLEFYVAKKTGKLTGWFSYTLSRTETLLQQGDDRIFVLNNFDKTHDLSTTWVTRLSPRTSLSGNFVLSTGIPVTLPSDKYVFEDNLIPHFTERNTSRLPDYHRLDLSLKVQGRKVRKNGSPRKNQDYWIFTIYNVYSRQNVNSYFFRESEQNPGQAEIVQYSLFATLIPSITYNFKF